MRRILTAAAIATSIGGTADLAAADPGQNRPEALAYVHLSFGGAQNVPQTFNYGLRMDYDRRFVGAAAPPLMQLDFNGTGFSAAKLNGLNLIRRITSVNQEEGGTAAGTVTYSVADWGLILLGVAGVGFAASEVSKVTESPDPKPGSGSGGGGGGSGGTRCTTTVPIPLPPGCTP